MHKNKSIFYQQTLKKFRNSETQKLKNSKSQNLRNLETQQLGVLVSWRLGDLKKRHERDIFLSHLRRFDFFCNLILQGFRTACFITCLGTAAPSELFKIPQFLNSYKRRINDILFIFLCRAIRLYCSCAIHSVALASFVPHSLASLHQ